MPVPQSRRCVAGTQILGIGRFLQGVSAASWPGRMQHLTTGALVEKLPDGWQLWLDGGHNPSAGAALADAISTWPDGLVVLVFAMQENKDAAGFLGPLATAADLIAIDYPEGRGMRRTRSPPSPVGWGWNPTSHPHWKLHWRVPPVHLGGAS